MTVFIGVWQEVAVDSLKFLPAPPWPTLLSSAGGWHVAVFYPFGYPHAVRPWTWLSALWISGYISTAGQERYTIPSVEGDKEIKVDPKTFVQIQRRMARDVHGLPKVSPGPTMPNPFTPYGRATPKTALRPFQGRPVSIFYPFEHYTRRRTPMV